MVKGEKHKQTGYENKCGKDGWEWEEIPPKKWKYNQEIRTRVRRVKDILYNIEYLLIYKITSYTIYNCIV